MVSIIDINYPLYIMYQASTLLFQIGYRKNTRVVMLNYEVLFTELRKILEILDKQLTVYYVKKKKYCLYYKLHAVFRTRQGVQGASVKILCFSFSVEIRKHCLLNGGTQCRAWSRH